MAVWSARAGEALVPPERPEVFPGREQGIEGDLLGNPSPRGPGAVVGGGEPQDRDPAAVRLDAARDGAHQGRLAGAVRAEQAQHLAGPEIEGDAVEGAAVAEALRDVADREGGGALGDGGHDGILPRMLASVQIKLSGFRRDAGCAILRRSFIHNPYLLGRPR